MKKKRNHNSRSGGAANDLQKGKGESSSGSRRDDAESAGVGGSSSGSAMNENSILSDELKKELQSSLGCDEDFLR